MSKLTYQSVIREVRSVMRMIDRPIATKTEVHGGNEQIKMKFPDNGLLVCSKAVAGSPHIEELYLLRSGTFIKAKRSESKTPKGVQVILREIQSATEDEVQNFVTPESLLEVILSVLDDRVISTLEKAKSLATKQESLTALKKENTQHVGEALRKDGNDRQVQGPGRVLRRTQAPAHGHVASGASRK